MTQQHDLSDVRRDYRANSLSRDSLLDDPFEQFASWFKDAEADEKLDPTAMTLATYNPEMGPTARIVLLKQYGKDGFCWYTDYNSLKGDQLREVPRAELLFYWPKLERQIRINGVVSLVDRKDSELYFNERPVGSRISAVASDQSQPVADRKTLEEKVAELEKCYADGNIPCPENWGGYRLIPDRFEFWQGRDNRLHDRFQFIKLAEGWNIKRLSP